MTSRLVKRTSDIQAYRICRWGGTRHRGNRLFSIGIVQIEKNGRRRLVILVGAIGFYQDSSDE